jgi:hypothetical protein
MKRKKKELLKSTLSYFFTLNAIISAANASEIQKHERQDYLNIDQEIVKKKNKNYVKFFGGLIPAAAVLACFLFCRGRNENIPTAGSQVSDYVPKSLDANYYKSFQNLVENNCGIILPDANLHLKIMNETARWRNQDVRGVLQGWESEGSELRKMADVLPKIPVNLNSHAGSDAAAINVLMPFSVYLFGIPKEIKGMYMPRMVCMAAIRIQRAVMMFMSNLKAFMIQNQADFMH